MEQIFLTYAIHFALSLIVGTLFCIGLFHSAQGESSVKPNGKETTDWGMIFYPITKFLSKKMIVPIYYEGSQLEDLFEKIKCDFLPQSEILKTAHVTKEGMIFDSVQYGEAFELLRCLIQKKYNLTAYIQDNEMVFFKTYEKPLYSQYWTKPLFLCYKCYASIWGTIIFSLMTAFSVKTGLIKMDWAIIIHMWVIYCFSLVTVNIWVNKKID